MIYERFYRRYVCLTVTYQGEIPPPSSSFPYGLFTDPNCQLQWPPFLKNSPNNSLYTIHTYTTTCVPKILQIQLCDWFRTLGVFFGALPCLKNSCQPCCKVLIFVHQGADIALVCTYALGYMSNSYTQAPVFLYAAERMSLLWLCEADIWGKSNINSHFCVCHFEISQFSVRSCLSLDVYLSLNRHKHNSRPLHLAKKHKLVSPKPSAGANYWALVGKVVLLSSLTSLKQNAGRGGWKNFSVTLEPVLRLELFFICIPE